MGRVCGMNGVEEKGIRGSGGENRSKETNFKKWADDIKVDL